jgi:diguanylate cyclase (GGDEF)-like protein/PAS domain S-box-containing protein
MASLDYKTLFESSDVGIATVEADATISLANTKLIAMLETHKEQLIGSSFLQWIYPDDRVMLANYHRKRIEGDSNVPQNYKVRLNKKDGFLWACINITFLKDSSVTIASVLDITLTEEKLQGTINAQDAILAAIPDLMFELARDGTYLNVWTQEAHEGSQSKSRLLGHTVTQILPANAAKEVMLTIEETYEKGYSFGHQIFIETPQSALWFELSASLKENANNSFSVIMLSRNITSSKELEFELLHLSRHDPLTSLYNRRTLQELLAKDMHRASRYNTPFSLCMLDIDFFKNINDSYGHLTGDLVLKQFSQLIKETLRDIDYSGRFGGEEFIVALPQTSLKHACEFAERLRKKIASYKFQDTTQNSFSITISIGVTTFSQEVHSIDNLLQKADNAMYLAKRAGRNCVKSSTEVVMI